MSNISDVAKRAGLSVSTVSRVINNHPHVKEEKRQTVFKAMTELNYKPSTAARQLRGQRSNILGIIIPRITNPYFSYLVDYIQEISFQNNFQIMIFQSNENQEREATFLALLSQKQIDGIIMCSVEASQDTIKEYTKYGPIVLCNAGDASNILPTVGLDQAKGTYMGIEYLIRKGYKKIAYVTGGFYEEKGIDVNRNKGFNKAMTEAELEINSSWIFSDCHTIEDGKKIAHTLVKLQELPDAIFTGSDEVAAGFIVEAQKLGLAIPNDIAVLGFDDQPLSELISPSITTIRQPIYELGKETVNLILSLLNKESYVVDDTNLSMNLVVREST